MKTIITIAILFFSVTVFAQPSAIKNKPAPKDTTGLSVSLKYKVVTDTAQVNFIVYDKEGYLKKESGKLVRKISVFENQSLKPEVTSASYFLDNWTAIKPETIYDIKQKQ